MCVLQKYKCIRIHDDLANMARRSNLHQGEVLVQINPDPCFYRLLGSKLWIKPHVSPSHRPPPTAQQQSPAFGFVTTSLQCLNTVYLENWLISIPKPKGQGIIITVTQQSLIYKVYNVTPGFSLCFFLVLSHGMQNAAPYIQDVYKQCGFSVIFKGNRTQSPVSVSLLRMYILIFLKNCRSTR